MQFTLKKADAFLCVWYICPDCGAENSVQICDNPLLNKGFHCTACKKEWTSDKLHQCLGIDDNKIFFGATEWLCECGRTNVIIPRIISTEDMPVRDDLNVKKQSLATPEYGLCEDCFTEYELNYPMPASVELFLRDNPPE